MPPPENFPDAAKVQEHESVNTAEHSMFVILQRNKNENTVVYSVNIVDGAINPADPVKVHWIMYTKGGTVEGLNMLERNSAYGVSCKPLEEAGHYQVKVAAMPERLLEVYLDEEGKPIAKAMINGKPAKWEQIFVQAKEGGWGLPKVDYVEIIGVELESGEPIVERVDKMKTPR